MNGNSNCRIYRVSLDIINRLSFGFFLLIILVISLFRGLIPTVGITAIVIQRSTFRMASQCGESSSQELVVMGGLKGAD